MIIIPTKQDLNKNHNDSPKGDKNNRHIIPMKLQGVIRNPFAFYFQIQRGFSGPIQTLPMRLEKCWWRGQDSNLRSFTQRILSPPPLTAREPRQYDSVVGFILDYSSCEESSNCWVLRRCSSFLRDI